MLEYLILSFTLVFFTVFAFIKLRYPFWNIQPVFHHYDYWRYFYYTPFIIFKYRPIKTKFCDFINIKTIEYLETDELDKTHLLNLLQCFYIPSDRIIHNIQQPDINALLTGQNKPSYISLYSDIEYQVDKENPENITTIKKPIGSISSRHMEFYYKENSTSIKYTPMPMYYFDYLCINRKSDNKKLSRKLLQTHEYNQRIKTPEVLVSLIKKEIELFDGIIPFIEYQTYTFSLRNIHFGALPAHHEVLQITAENTDILFDFLHIQKNIHMFPSPFSFEVLILPEIGNLISLIKQRILFVFILRHGTDVLGMYFIKDAKMHYEDVDEDCQTLQCSASIANCESNALFYLGYLHSLRQIIEKNKAYRMILMESIGHNCYLIPLWRQKHTPIFINSTAYYLYNMVYPTCPMVPEQCFILT